MATARCIPRKSFDGLANGACQVLAKDPVSGHVFVFLSRRKSLVKLLLWTRRGFTIVARHLGFGTFSFPQRGTSCGLAVEVDADELSILLEFIDASASRASRPEEGWRLPPARLSTLPTEPPVAGTGTAIHYLRNNEYLIPIDNRVVQRLELRTALTRKNLLFDGSDAGGYRAAIAYTVRDRCALGHVDRAAYFANVLPRLSRRVRRVDVPALMPAAGSRARPARWPPRQTLPRARADGRTRAGGSTRFDDDTRTKDLSLAQDVQ